MQENDRITNDTLEQIKRIFIETEDQIKKSERATQQLHIPAINELRYAGHHLLKGLTNNHASERDEQLRRALRHCQRARYDAVEILLWYYLGEFKKFQDDYRTVVIPQVWPEYLDDCQKFENTKSILESVVKSEDIDDQTDNRVTLLNQTLEVNEQLAPIVTKAAVSRAELNKQLEDKQADENRDRRTWLIGIFSLVLSAVGILIALIALKQS